MPFFSFRIWDGPSRIDREGATFACRAEARRAAIQLAADLLDQAAASPLPPTDWRLEVVDETGATVLYLGFTMRSTGDPHAETRPGRVGEGP